MIIDVQDEMVKYIIGDYPNTLNATLYNDSGETKLLLNYFVLGVGSFSETVALLTLNSAIITRKWWQFKGSKKKLVFENGKDPAELTDLILEALLHKLFRSELVEAGLKTQGLAFVQTHHSKLKGQGGVIQFTDFTYKQHSTFFYMTNAVSVILKNDLHAVSVDYVDNYFKVIVVETDEITYVPSGYFRKVPDKMDTGALQYTTTEKIADGKTIGCHVELI